MSGLLGFSEFPDGAQFLVADPDANRVAQAVSLALGGDGYVLEEGLPTGGVYGKGSKFARALLGAFVARYKMRVTVMAQPGGSQVTLQKGMSGWGGGAIGASKMKSELKRLTSVLHARFSATPGPGPAAT